MIWLHLTIFLRCSFNKFPDFFVQAFKIVVDSWKFSILLLSSYEMTGQFSWFQLQISSNWNTPLLKPDSHSWWISKMQSGREDTLEERYAIKFCFKLGKNATETYGMLQIAFGASCMNRSSVFEWHKRFNEGRETVRDDERCGRSKEARTPELIGQIKNFMDKDRRVSIETISAQFDVSVGTVHKIIREELKMQKICVKFLPRVLREDQKKDVFMTAGRWLSWSIQIPQFLMFGWPAMKAGSTAMTQRPRKAWEE